jgi:hypothetical protein
MEPVDGELQAQINKRLTLNLLIQGAATHTFLTAHHLVSDELTEIHPKLVRLYDRIAVATLLNYWYGDTVLIYGLSGSFWRGMRRPCHPFARHPLLVKHGPALADATRRAAVQRAWSKRILALPGYCCVHSYGLLVQTLHRERRHKGRLEALAREATNQIWGIAPDRLNARLAMPTPFGEFLQKRTTTSARIELAAAGFSGVVRDGSRLVVMAQAVIWPLLVHELVKGTAELVCLHGLNELDAETYSGVVREADKLEEEVWLMQAGAELWRRLLAAMRPGRSLPTTLMSLAKLPPQTLEEVMLAVARDPVAARPLIGALSPPSEVDS